MPSAVQYASYYRFDVNNVLYLHVEQLTSSHGCLVTMSTMLREINQTSI